MTFSKKCCNLIARRYRADHFRKEGTKTVYRFSYNDDLEILKDERPIFSGITVSARPNAQDITYTAKLAKSDESSAFFEDAEHGLSIVLTIANVSDTFTLKVKADYKAKNLGENRFGVHFDPENAIKINIASVSEAECFTANFLKCEFWCHTVFAKTPAELPREKIQGLLYSRNDGEFFYVAPVCDKVFKSNMKGENDGSLSLYLWSNDLRDTCDSVALVMGSGKNAYELVPHVTEAALNAIGNKGGLRNKRRYPEIFEYLGWCSWDAFHMDVTHDDLLKKAKEFRDKDIPVNWFIIDDMWGHVPAITRKTMHSRELYSFEADPERFPNGLKAVITDLKDQYGITTGMWHPTTGYWNGIDPAGDIARDHRELLVHTPNNKLVHSPELVPAFEYYNTVHSFYRDCGAEFVKVDNQGFIRAHYKYLKSIGEAAKNLHTAIEASVGANFDGALINCMSMPSENFWNRPVSSICRFSGDFQPENRKWFIQHLLQCSFNSLFQGCVYYGDWDMWWSDDEQAKKNAVLRAMSGGPVYMSDELDRSIKETIMPIVYSDGRIVRLENPPMPSPDCLMTDPETNGRIFKVVNRVGDYGIMAAFNLDKNEKTVKGTVSAKDVGLDGSYVCYDWFARKIIKPESTLKLKNYDDFRLYIFLPVKNGKAFIGLTEKYMSPRTIDYIGNGMYRLHEGGKLGIYSKTKLNSIVVDGEKVAVTNTGECLYEAMIKTNGAVISFK